MRSPMKSVFIIQILAAVQLSVAANLFAAEDYAHLTQETSDQKQWICDYTRAANDVLYLRCEDRLSLTEDPLIMEGNEVSDTQYIPIWSMPSDDHSAIRLVESVLCTQYGNCNVEMKSVSRSNRYANR